MSTEFEVKLPSVALNRYWGGASKKSCVQVTQYNSKLNRSNYGYHAIQLTKKDAGILGKALLDFSTIEKERRNTWYHLYLDYK